MDFEDRFWGFVLWTIAIVGLVVIMATAAYLVDHLFIHPAPYDVCTITTSQACLDKRFDACMATEKYSRAECIDLVGKP